MNGLLALMLGVGVFVGLSVYGFKVLRELDDWKPIGKRSAKQPSNNHGSSSVSQ